MLNAEKAKEDEDRARIMWGGERPEFVEMGGSSEDNGGSEVRGIEDDGGDERIRGNEEIEQDGEDEKGKENSRDGKNPDDAQTRRTEENGDRECASVERGKLIRRAEGDV